MAGVQSEKNMGVRVYLLTVINTAIVTSLWGSQFSEAKDKFGHREILKFEVLSDNAPEVCFSVLKAYNLNSQTLALRSDELVEYKSSEKFLETGVNISQPINSEGAFGSSVDYEGFSAAGGYFIRAVALDDGIERPIAISNEFPWADPPQEEGLHHSPYATIFDALDYRKFNSNIEINSYLQHPFVMIFPPVLFTDTPAGTRWKPPQTNFPGYPDKVKRIAIYGKSRLFFANFDHRFFWIQREIDENLEILVFEVTSLKERKVIRPGVPRYDAMTSLLCQISPNLSQ